MGRQSEGDEAADARKVDVDTEFSKVVPAVSGRTEQVATSTEDM